MVYLTDFIKGCIIFRNYWMLNTCMCLCVFASWVQWFLLVVKKRVWLAFSSVQLLICVQLFAALWTAGHQASLIITNSQSLLKLISIKSVMPSNHFILCHPLFLLPSIFCTIRSFLMSQLFTSGDRSIGASVSASVLPMNNQDWSPLGWICWISLQPKGLSRIFFNITVQKRQFFSAQLSLEFISHIHTWLLEKP